MKNNTYSTLKRLIIALLIGWLSSYSLNAQAQIIIPGSYQPSTNINPALWLSWAMDSIMYVHDELAFGRRKRVAVSNYSASYMNTCNLGSATATLRVRFYLGSTFNYGGSNDCTTDLDITLKGKTTAVGPNTFVYNLGPADLNLDVNQPEVLHEYFVCCLRVSGIVIFFYV